MTEEDKNQQNESVKKLKRKNNNKNKKIKKPKLEEVETIGSELITKVSLIDSIKQLSQKYTITSFPVILKFYFSFNLNQNKIVF